MERAVASMWKYWLEPGELYPEVGAVLEELQSMGYRLGLVSNWAPCLDETLDHLGILDAFETVVCSSLVGARKPSPEMFLAATSSLDVGPERCTFVGDDPHADIEGATSAGMQAVLVHRQGAGSVRQEVRAESSYPVVGNLQELLTDAGVAAVQRLCG